MARFIGLKGCALPNVKYGPSDRPAEATAAFLINRRRENMLSIKVFSFNFCDSRHGSQISEGVQAARDSPEIWEPWRLSQKFYLLIRGVAYPLIFAGNGNIHKSHRLVYDFEMERAMKQTCRDV